MISKEKLIQLYIEHISNNNIPYLDDSFKPAILFSAKEIKYRSKKKKSQLFVPSLGWIECEKMFNHDINQAEWVALCTQKDEYSLLFGFGNPFENTHQLPTKNGYVIAVPYSFNN